MKALWKIWRTLKKDGFKTLDSCYIKNRTKQNKYTIHKRFLRATGDARTEQNLAFIFFLLIHIIHRNNTNSDRSTILNASSALYHLYCVRAKPNSNVSGSCFLQCLLSMGRKGQENLFYTTKIIATTMLKMLQYSSYGCLSTANFRSLINWFQPRKPAVIIKPEVENWPLQVSHNTPLLSAHHNRYKLCRCQFHDVLFYRCFIKDGYLPKIY